jgi:hypothetical protein
MTQHHLVLNIDLTHNTTILLHKETSHTQYNKPHKPRSDENTEYQLKKAKVLTTSEKIKQKSELILPKF